MATDVSNYLTNIDGIYFDAVSNILEATDNKTAGKFIAEKRGQAPF